MNKIQYINYFKLKGVEEMPKEKTIGDLMDDFGKPTQAEMVKVNEMTFQYFIEENAKLKKEKEALFYEVERLQKKADWLLCLEQAGVDNWEGYNIAIDIKDTQTTHHPLKVNY